MRPVHRRFAHMKIIVGTGRRIADGRMLMLNKIIHDGCIHLGNQSIPVLDLFEKDIRGLSQHLETGPGVPVRTDGRIAPAVTVMEHEPVD